MEIIRFRGTLRQQVCRSAKEQAETTGETATVIAFDRFDHSRVVIAEVSLEKPVKPDDSGLLNFLREHDSQINWPLRAEFYT